MIVSVVELIFWTSASLLAYIYVGYPMLIYIVGGMFPKPVRRGSVEPKVTVLITAFNEEASIHRKLENTLRIRYPADKLEILVASDGSTDQTDEIVRSFESRGVKLFRQEGRVGKTVTQNHAVAIATGDIILFSDATTTYREDVFDELLPSFADLSSVMAARPRCP